MFSLPPYHYYLMALEFCRRMQCRNRPAAQYENELKGSPPFSPALSAYHLKEHVAHKKDRLTFIVKINL